MFDAFKEAGFDNEQEQAVIGKRSVSYISNKSRLLFPSAEMFKKSLWQTV